MRHNSAKEIALGGVLAALAMVMFFLGSLVPIATFICPMICMVILRFFCRLCGNRLGWAWYGGVALLAMLLVPDKESVAVFVSLGYYPIIKPKMDRLRFSWLWKSIFFNAVILLMYQILIYVIGLSEMAEEYAQLGAILTAVLLLFGNICFFLLDYVLTHFGRRRKCGG